MRATILSVIRAKGERSLSYQFTQIENTRVRRCRGPLLIRPMGLGIRNVESISTVRSLRSNGPQLPPPKKPLINAHHIAPSEVMSRRLVKSHLEKRNGRTIKKGRQTSIITNSSDTSKHICPRAWGASVPVLGEAGTRLTARFPVNLTERPRGQDL